MGVMLVYCADWLTCEVPYEGDANASWVATRRMRTHTCPATSLVYVAFFTHNKVVANVDPSIVVHVVVLVRTDYGRTIGLCSAESLGGPVVNYINGHRPRQWVGRGRRRTCASPCSADNIRTCCGIKESFLISIHCVPCIVLWFIKHNNTVLHHLITPLNYTT